MAFIKAHITFSADHGKDAETRTAALAKIQRTVEIAQINQKRFDRYGVLSGLIEEDKLEELRRLPEIGSVEVDQVRHLS